MSRLRYTPQKNTWYEYQIHNKSIVALKDNWVRAQFPPDKVNKCIEEAEKGSRRFIRLEPGDIIEVIPTMDISKNPMVRYPQGQLDTCAFSSFASALFHIGFTEQANIIHNYGVEWTTFHYDTTYKTLERLVNFIRKETKFQNFRRLYEPRKIKQGYDIFQETPRNEIRLIVLIMSDNTETHAVSVVSNFVFDSNCRNALPLTKEGLDCCCGVDASFIGVSKGYNFNRTNKNVFSKPNN